MIPTVPIDLSLNVAVGASVALASRAVIPQQRLLRSPALWSLVIMQALVFVPVGAYLLWRFPAWSLMYLMEPASLPVPDVALVVTYPIAAVASFVITWRLLSGERLAPAIAVLAGALVVTLLITYLGRDALLVVGSVAAYREGPDGMLSIFDSALVYLVAASGVAVTVSWANTLWRVVMLARSGRGSVQASAGSSLRVNTTRKSKTRKKSSA
ncbi:MAG: hypothetical protein HYZ27_07430 [Deltaproteobacteria bacterium]|nr:hypothetical protein [Deltaproteobacteria bacterium]